MRLTFQSMRLLHTCEWQNYKKSTKFKYVNVTKHSTT